MKKLYKGNRFNLIEPFSPEGFSYNDNTNTNPQQHIGQVQHNPYSYTHPEQSKEVHSSEKTNVKFYNPHEKITQEKKEEQKLPSFEHYEQNRIKEEDYPYDNLSEESEHKNPIESEEDNYLLEEIENGDPLLISTTVEKIPGHSIKQYLNLPIAAYIKPFGKSSSGEDPPVVTTNNFPLVRCRQCKGYINQFAKFTYQGKSWICPLCYQRNYVPDHYFKPLNSKVISFYNALLILPYYKEAKK